MSGLVQANNSTQLVLMSLMLKILSYKLPLSVMAEAAPAPLQGHQHLNKLVKKLTSLIQKLLTSLPCGSKDGPITKNPWPQSHLSWQYGRDFQQVMGACFSVSGSKTVIVKEWMKKGSEQTWIMWMMFIFSHNMIIIWLNMNIFEYNMLWVHYQ